MALGDPVRPTNAGLAAAFLLAAAVGMFVYEGVAHWEQDVALAAEPTDPPAEAARFATTPPAPPETVDVTLPAFAHTTLELHSAHAPLGVVTAFGR